MIDHASAATPTHPPEHSPVRELSDTAVGAVVALVRVVELYDSDVAHRSALRALVAERLFFEYTAASLPAPASGLRGDASLVVASAALAEIDLVISRPDNPEASNEPTRSLLSSTLVGSLEGLNEVANSLEHYREYWDGTGLPNGAKGCDIPLAARVAAVADALVGNPTAGFIPSWHHARRRVQRQIGTALDPSLCDALERLELEDIVVPPVPSIAIGALLDRAPNTRLRADTTDAASTIRNAVALAASQPDLLHLFASTALRTVDAAEVLILRSSSTQLDSTPVARADDGCVPVPLPSRLNDIFEFSTQAEIRAGATITRDSTGAAGVIDEVITPLVVGGEPWGALVATRRQPTDGFTDGDVELLAHIATEMTDAVASTTHWAEMERMALRDQLTGLGNRHELYRVLDAIFDRPTDERIDSALIMCDVDGLKIVNDTMGHHAGDRLLIDAAEALKGAVRDPESTTVCRIGGDEFCMVIDGGALLTAHDISDTIERLFERSAGSGPARSISCGIAFAEATVDSRSSLLRAADENQYETKRARKAAQADEVLAIGTGDATDSSDRRAIRD